MKLLPLLLAALLAAPRAAGAQAADTSAYAAALAGVRLQGGERMPVVLDSTLTFTERAPLIASVPEALRASFVAASGHRQPVTRADLPDERYLLVGATAFEGMPRGDADAYWREFAIRFPRAGGVVSLSGIGRSADGERAVVYVQHGCGSLCGSSHLVLLRREQGVWRVEQARMTTVN